MAGKHVPSGVPLPGGPRDATAKVSAHRGANPGFTSSTGPVTAGLNPDPPARRLASPDDALTSPTPVTTSGPLVFPPNGGCC